MDDDTDDKDDSKRKSRNLSEKKRRDQFNLLVNELSSMVSSNNRKMDKSTVLKSTIVFLKNHNEIAVRSRAHEIQEDWKPSYLSNEEFTHLILEALDGFIIVFSSTGRIFYASESVTSLLGHLPNDLLNMTIYDLAHEDDHSELYNILLNPVTVADPVQNDNQVIFSCHLKKGGLDHHDEPSFDLVHFVGYFRSDVDLDNMIAHNPTFNYPNEADTRLIFIGTGRLQTPQLIREMTIVESTKNEFTSRHSLEWKFLYLDHRAPPIIGYLPFEVLGTSGYDYYHFDDLEKVISCHEALIQKGESTSCYYRFLTKGQQWIWLQSRFYITYHQWNSKPEFVVCTHRVVSYADVIQHSRNNGSEVLNKDLQNPNSVTRDLNLKAASSILLSSPWSSKSSRASRFATTPNSPSGKSRQRNDSYQGTDSDSTSISTESKASRHSMMTHYSSRPRIRQNTPTTKKITQHQKPELHSHQSEQIPQTHTTPYRTVLQSQPHTIVPPMPPPQPIGTTFLEPTQYIAAIPVQSAPTISIPTSTTVISPLQPPAILHHGVVMTPSRTQVHEHLERQHEELGQLILQQKEELRRISEQLLMARYGLLPSIVNVAVPCTPNASTTNMNRNAGSASAQIHINSQQQLHPHHNNHNAVCSSTENPMQHQELQENTVCQQNPSEVDTNEIGGEEMISYMQLTTVTSSHLQQHLQHHSQNRISIEHQHQHHHQQQQQQQQQQQHQQQQQQQQQQISGENEVMPFQMTQEQAQLLFASNLSPNTSQQNH